MRTSNTVLNAQSYANGQPVLQGDPIRVYSSSIIASMRITMVKAPEGATVWVPADAELIATMRSLKHGQIGAVHSDTTVENSTTACEVQVPVGLTDAFKVKEALIKNFSLGDYTKSKTIQYNGKAISLEELKDKLAVHRATNKAIRTEWSGQSKRLSDRGMSGEDILTAKQRLYKDYISMSDWCAKCELHITHYVHNPSIQGYVYANNDPAEYARFNYDETPVRKVSTTWKSPEYIVPIVSLNDYYELIKFLKNSVSRDRLDAISKHAEQLIIEGSPFNNTEVDFKAIRDHDRKIR